jgi:hypothetical protein
MRIDGDTVKFRSGKEEYANCGIIGLSPDGSAAGGYDGGFPGYDDSELTKEERVELAEYMIVKWKLFAAKEVEA